MSTTIGFVTDAVDPDYSLEVYTGTGGVALLIHSPPTSSVVQPRKIWLNDEGVRQLVELLHTSGFGPLPGLPRRNGDVP